jgi:hypothetical protein
VHAGMFAIAIGATAIAMVACDSLSPGEPAEPAPTSLPAPAHAAASIDAPVALPPNADGDPPCPAADAWGREPSGAGILVTHWSDDSARVTVLVRTKVGRDQAQRAALNAGELRLFEFPDIEESAVSEVLIMTDTRRCYVSADPAALG